MRNFNHVLRVKLGAECAFVPPCNKQSRLAATKGTTSVHEECKPRGYFVFASSVPICPSISFHVCVCVLVCIQANLHWDSPKPRRIALCVCARAIPTNGVSAARTSSIYLRWFARSISHCDIIPYHEIRSLVIYELLELEHRCSVCGPLNSSSCGHIAARAMAPILHAVATVATYYYSHTHTQTLIYIYICYSNFLWQFPLKCVLRVCMVARTHKR